MFHVSASGQSGCDELDAYLAGCGGSTTPGAGEVWSTAIVAIPLGGRLEVHRVKIQGLDVGASLVFSLRAPVLCGLGLLDLAGSGACVLAVLEAVVGVGGTIGIGRVVLWRVLDCVEGAARPGGVVRPIGVDLPGRVTWPVVAIRPGRMIESRVLVGPWVVILLRLGGMAGHRSPEVAIILGVLILRLGVCVHVGS